MLRSTGILVLSLLTLACGGTPPVDGDSPDASTPPLAATTTLEPAPGVFNGALTVTLRTDRAATIHVTKDGSDPLSSSTRSSGPSPLTVELTATTTLTFASVTGEGATEATRTGEYTRAGGPVGSVAGNVVVGEILVDRALVLIVDGEEHALPSVDEPGAVPFFVEGLESGTHTFLALGERNGDGSLSVLADFRSNAEEVTLDLEDPTAAAHEGLTLYLAASPPELATIFGDVTIPGAAGGKSLSVLAVDPSTVSDGAALFEQLREADSVALSSAQTVWPYAVTDLTPGNYIPLPVVNRVSATGASMNLLASLSSAAVDAGDAVRRNFTYGNAAVSGKVTMSGQGSGLILQGAVAARNFEFANGIQAVVMPVVFVRNVDGDHVANYSATDLRQSVTFNLRAFIGASAMSDAFQWVVNPLSAAPAHSTVDSGAAASQTTHDFTAN